MNSKKSSSLNKFLLGVQVKYIPISIAYGNIWKYMEMYGNVWKFKYTRRFPSSFRKRKIATRVEKQEIKKMEGIEKRMRDRETGKISRKKKKMEIKYT